MYVSYFFCPSIYLKLGSCVKLTEIESGEKKEGECLWLKGERTQLNIRRTQWIFVKWTTYCQLINPWVREVSLRWTNVKFVKLLSLSSDVVQLSLEHHVWGNLHYVHFMHYHVHILLDPIAAWNILYHSKMNCIVYSRLNV